MTTQNHADKIVIIQGELTNFDHINAIIALVNEYRTDQMGGNLDKLSVNNENNLIEGLKNHPSSLILFAVLNETIIGMAICFWGFSTFETKWLLNIHDLIVYKKNRRRGIGKALLKGAMDIAQKNDCCRLTLEVRNDNNVAKRLYNSVGFTSCDFPMEFWIRKI
jgi:ribosomal protein S18 acetylase RimI-like enzyme